jgi:tRNA G26 N,N-dimethylase Trm1
MISEANIVLFTGTSERNSEETETSSIPKTDTLEGAKKSKAKKNSMIEKVWGGGGYYNPQMTLYRDFVVLTAHVVAKQRQEIARKIAEKESKQEVAVLEPEVAVSEPEVTVSKPVSEPEVKVCTPEVSNETEVLVSELEVTVSEPDVRTSEPKITVSKPVSEPEVKVSKPEVSNETEVLVSELEVTVIEPDVRASESKTIVSDSEEEKEDLNYFRFVDAFSGTGVLGIRIAKTFQNTIICEGTEFKVLVHSNDISPVCYELIRKNARVNLAPLLPNKGMFFKRTNQDVNVLLHTIAAGVYPEQDTIREIPWQANKNNIPTVCLCGGGILFPTFDKV